MSSANRPNGSLWLFDARLKGQRDYWLRRLVPLPAPARLPRAEAPGSREEGVGGPSAPEQVRVRIEGKLLAALDQLTNGSPFLQLALLLSSLKLCLHRYSGASVITVGTPVLLKGAGETSRNTVVISVTIDSTMSIRRFLLDVRETLLAAYEHQDYPFERLSRDLGLEPEKGGSSLFSVLAMWEGIHGEVPSCGQEATLVFRREPAAVVVECTYRPDLLGRDAAGRLCRHLLALLGSALSDTQRALGQLSLLSSAERHQLTVEWNDTAVAATHDETLHGLFEAQARRSPEAIAITWCDRELLYAELEARANQLAHHLLALGVGPGVAVGVLLERSPELVIALLAVLKAGGIWVAMDPSHPSARLSVLVEDSAVAVLITKVELLERVPSPPANVICIDRDTALWSDGPAHAPRSGVGSAHLAYILYTSGSTGRPKGVMVAHRGIVHYLRWAAHAYRIGSGTGCPVHSSIAFDLTLTSLFTPLISGLRVDLLPEDRHPIEELAAALSGGHRYSLVKLTPAHLEALSHWLQTPESVRTRAFVIGGEALFSAQLEPWRTSGVLRLINEYGPTEAVVGCCVYEVAPGEKLSAAVPIGRPIAGARLLVTDRGLAPVPIGVVGELSIGGIGLARGYLGKARNTAERFVPDPASHTPGERVYRTGDLVRWLGDGNLVFLGRGDHQVKVLGHRVELGEIETALLRCPGVQAAVVALHREARPRADMAGNARLVAWVVADEIEVPDPERLCQQLGEQLPEHMVPAVVMVLDALPLTPNGKVDRARLPAPVVRASAGDLIARRSPVQEVVLGIWKEVLGVEQLSGGDDFFALGGHSLLVTQALSRVRATLGVTLPMSAIFEAPVFDAFSARVETAFRLRSVPEPGAIAPAPEGAPRVLSTMQQDLWLVDQLKPGSLVFNVPAILRLAGRLERRALEHSISQVVRRHEILRSCFPARAGEPSVEVWALAAVPLPLVDLGRLPPRQRAAEELRLLASFVRRPFDLGRGPLLRVVLLRLGSLEHLLVSVMHHAVTDGWSIAVWVRELAACYRAISRGERIELPALPIQYTDYAAWQRRWLDGELLERHLEYWHRQLHGAPSLVSWRGRQPRPKARRLRGALREIELPEDLSRRLQGFSQERGATLFMVLLAGFAIALHQETGMGDLVIGTDVARRDRVEIEGLIGYFVNQVALRIGARPEMSLEQVLDHVREVTLEAYLHQELSFGQVVEALGVGRSLSHAPLFQIKLLVQSFPQPDLELPELVVTPVNYDVGTAQLDLIVALKPTPEGLRGWINYNLDLFDVEAVEKILKAYCQALELLASEPGLRLDEGARRLELRQGMEATHQRKEKARASFARLRDRIPTSMAHAADDQVGEAG